VLKEIYQNAYGINHRTKVEKELCAIEVEEKIDANGDDNISQTSTNVDINRHPVENQQHLDRIDEDVELQPSTVSVRVYPQFELGEHEFETNSRPSAPIQPIRNAPPPPTSTTIENPRIVVDETTV
jgi:hypothetical protein